MDIKKRINKSKGLIAGMAVAASLSPTAQAQADTTPEATKHEKAVRMSYQVCLYQVHDAVAKKVCLPDVDRSDGVNIGDASIVAKKMGFSDEMKAWNIGAGGILMAVNEQGFMVMDQEGNATGVVAEGNKVTVVRHDASQVSKVDEKTGIVFENSKEYQKEDPTNRLENVEFMKHLSAKADVSDKQIVGFALNGMSAFGVQVDKSVLKAAMSVNPEAVTDYHKKGDVHAQPTRTVSVGREI